MTPPSCNHVAAALRAAHPPLGPQPAFRSPHPRHGEDARCRHRGFTLVEMLLATALCAVLLGALWMLLSTYGELFDKGQRQVERAQLCRALLDQMAEDLRSAIQDPLPGTADEIAGAAQRRRFGLFGSSRELRFDILQLTPQQGNLVPVGRAAGATEETRTARVPELRTVHYTFLEPTSSGETPQRELSDSGEATELDPSTGESSLASQTGLVRSELDFETPLETAIEPDMAGESAIPVDPDLTADPDAATDLEAEDDTRLWVPEVVSLQFRYFDGRGWSDTWNSLTRKALPAAVEIQLQLADLPARRPGGVGQAEPSDMDMDVEAEAVGDELGQPALDLAPPASGISYRLVVDLPNSPQYRPPPVERQTLVRPLARPPVRRTVPARATPPAAPAPLPEDWIRTATP
jgi:prepilin-type N-terminal cleavage/methylation domain-containing protein